MTEWHGWSRGEGPAIHIGRLPGRKSICLYISDGSVVTPVAYFRDEEGARRALDLLNELIMG